MHGIGSHFAEAAGKNVLSEIPAEKLIGNTGLTSGQFAAKIAAHAAVGGVTSVLNGGKFGHGFASAGVVEAFSPALMRLEGSGAAIEVLAAAVVGGTASVASGGKFANGAMHGAAMWAFNELSMSLRRQGYHDLDDGYVARVDSYNYEGKAGFEVTVYKDSKGFRDLAENGQWKALRGSEHEVGTFDEKGFRPKHTIKDWPNLPPQTETNLRALTQANAITRSLDFTWSRQALGLEPSRALLKTASGILRRTGVFFGVATTIMSPSTDHACSSGAAEVMDLEDELCR
jgi:hypothetical protein